ncbi:ribonuclease E/G [Hyphobacterium sp. SN044]|uniref:ribonuclease E/G n=1 Tax=Hyphobacterium sp. SN044 TaxID=2912575 RepID=UPI001F20E904|nr:ribonuclease E/G [Hyphobacterium sp. SN044]MCF8878626.1 ribonuclease E/G [Hyphobacterium sp. SN044]
MSRIVAVEDAIGETRVALADNGRVVELHIERWSEAGLRARAGALYLGRIRTIDARLNAAFVDLGVGEAGFLPFGKAGRPAGLHEGAAIPVRVTREAHAGKGPTLAREEGEFSADAPRLLEDAAPLAERVAARFQDAEARWADEVRIDIAEAIDEALSREVAIPGGGRLIIEPTAALTAIDVDMAGRQGQNGALGAAEKIAADLNRSAAKEAARQIRLRGLGGVIAIDFVHMRDRKIRLGVEQVLKAAVKHDPARIDIAPISPFGIVELARQRTGRSLSELLNGPGGQPSDETLALNAIRRLESEGRSDRRRQLKLRVSPAIAAWLDAEHIAWRDALTQRIGPRFALETVDTWPRERFDVSSK